MPKLPGALSGYNVGPLVSIETLVASPQTTSMKHITDGLSKTIFVGEVLVGHLQELENGWVTGVGNTTTNGDGRTTTAIPLNVITKDTTAAATVGPGMQQLVQPKLRQGLQIGPSQNRHLRLRRWRGEATR
jgi:hypothetical protein